MGASDSKGWTVFMERQPIPPPEDVPVAAPQAQAQAQATAEPVAGRTVMMDQAPSVVAPEASVPTSVQPPVEASRAPQVPAVAPPTSVAKPEGSSKLPIYIGVGVVVVIIIVLVLKFAI